MKPQCVYFTLGYTAALLTTVIVLVLISVGRGERGSGRKEVERFAQASSAQTQTNPEHPPDKNGGRRD